MEVECSRLPLDSRRRPTVQGSDDRHVTFGVPYATAMERGVRWPSAMYVRQLTNER